MPCRGSDSGKARTNSTPTCSPAVRVGQHQPAPGIVTQPERSAVLPRRSSCHYVPFAASPVNQLHLRLVQAGIAAARSQQFIVPADLGDVAVFHDDKTIRPPQRAESMGDGDGRSAADQVLQRRLNLALGLGVHRRSRFVENEDARIDRAGRARWRCAGVRRRTAIVRVRPPANRNRTADAG